MNSFDSKAVFFVRDAPGSLDHYTKKLGFSLDWIHEEQGKPFVFQVSLCGFRLILNQSESWTEARAGHGRVFIGLDETQAMTFRQHVASHGIETASLSWGGPTTVIHDLDQNELFFWLPEVGRAGGQQEAPR